MKHSRESTRTIVVNNLKSLMTEFGIQKQDLPKKSGVSSRMVSYILAGERTPSIEILDKLASAFGITGWQLMVPNLHASLVRNGRLEKLIQSYVEIAEEGRELIDRVAQRETEYKRAS